MLAAGVVVLSVSLIPRFAGMPLAQPVPFALLYAAGVILLAWTLWRVFFFCSLRTPYSAFRIGRSAPGSPGQRTFRRGVPGADGHWRQNQQ